MQGDLNSRGLFKNSIVDFPPTITPIKHKNQAKRTFGSRKTYEGMWSLNTTNTPQTMSPTENCSSLFPNLF